MDWQRSLVITRLAVMVAVFFPSQGWAQDFSENRLLERLFYSLLPYAAMGGAVIGTITGISVRRLAHHQGIHFPSKVRKVAFTVGWGLILLSELVFIGVGVWSDIGLVSLFTYEKGAILIPLLTAFLWYIAAYVSIRLPRWSGRYALSPRRLIGDRV